MVAPPESLLIFDTTLRDGELAPGCSMSLGEKLRIAAALAELKVDVIEAGFPAVSAAHFESVAGIAQAVQGPTVCALARPIRSDIELAAQALSGAARRRLHVFLPTSGVHRGGAPSATAERILTAAVDGVRMAREFCDDVEFSPEDASRTEIEFLAQLVEAVIEAGAGTINIADTVGYSVPDEFAELFRYLRQNVRGIERVRLSVHCHDDLGMAVANSLTAVVAGARQIECTVNGIGERAGNCPLEEVVMALKTRAAFFNLKTQVDATRLYPTSRLVASITGMPIARNKAVVGENAFALAGEAHPHGMSRYEIMQPADVGLARTQLVLGKHSDRDALRQRITELGFELDAVQLERLLEDFQALAARKKELFDGDIEALVLRAQSAAAGPWTLDELTVSFSTRSAAEARVALLHRDGRRIERAAQGDGPVDATFKAIEAATGIEVALRKFEVRAVTEGEDAQGEAVVHVEYNLRRYHGASVSTNIVESAGRAFLEVINRIELAQPTAPHAEEVPAIVRPATAPV